jgi:hypothetical protein
MASSPPLAPSSSVGLMHNPRKHVAIFLAASWACVLAPILMPLAHAEESRPATLFALPIELETDGGAENGDASFMRIMPIYEGPRFEDWKLVHLNMIVLSDAPGGRPGSPGNPEPVDGGRATGLSDIFHGTFYTPITNGDWTIGYGALASFPTATDDVLGSGKWTAGPAFRVTYRSSLWTLGGFGGQRWSFAGDSDRADVNQFMFRGTVRRELSDDWYLVSAPIVTVNWNAKSNDRLLFPLGGGIGRSVPIGRAKWAISVQGYTNIAKPEGAPDWSARLSVIALVPQLF